MIRISYIEQAIAIFTIHLHMHQQTWESTVFNHCSPSFHLYSRCRTQQMHACFQLGLSAVQTSEPMSKTRGNTLLVLLLCNVSYRIVSYRIVTTLSGYVSYRGRMYRCRPTSDMFITICDHFNHVIGVACPANWHLKSTIKKKKKPTYTFVHFQNFPKNVSAMFDNRTILLF